MRSPSRRSWLSRAPVMVGLTLVGAFSLIGVLAAAGIVELPFLKKKPQLPTHEGEVEIIISSQEIPAYTAINREHFVDAASKRVTSIWIRPEEIRHDIIRDPSQIVGRVLRKTKGPGFAFFESDFLPPKTRPGLVGGIPPGLRALALDADKLRGIHALRAGDHFDLLATAPLEDSSKTGRHGPTTLNGGAAAAGPRRAQVRVLVQNGVVVVPASVWKAPDPPKTDKAHPPANTKPPPPEIVIAGEPKEIVALSEALALKHDIVAIARSGRPEDPGSASLTPGLTPQSGVRTMELLHGNKRQVLTFGGPHGVVYEEEPETKPQAPPPTPAPMPSEGK